MSLDRRRIAIACEPCRRGKRKCDGSRPVCNLCRRRLKECVYVARLPPPSGESTGHLRAEIDRLQSLVETLTGASERDAARPRVATDAASAPLESHGLDWTSHAAREISQLTQRRVNPGGLGSASIYLLDPQSDLDPTPPPGWDVIPAWPSRMHDCAFRRAAVQCFSERINRFECLIDDEYLSELSPSLDQPYYMLVLLLAIISASTVVTRENQVGDGLVQCAERMVIRACVTPEATLVVVRALTILVWRELTVGGNPTRTWMFNCMAAALLQQLGVFDWSAETIEQERQSSDFSSKLGAFWSFSAVDRVSAALLGRMSSIPWRHDIQVPRYSVSIKPGIPITIEKLYFDHLWALWRLHGYYMNILYTPRLDGSRLKLEPGQVDGHPFPYFLQMAFDTSPITLNLPFLGQSSSEQLECFQEMVKGASSHTDLLFRFRKAHQLTESPPVVIYFTIRAATIQLLLATSTDPTVYRRSSRRLKICLESLEECQNMWERQASRAIRYIQGLAVRWGVTKALPLKFSYPPLDLNQVNRSEASPEAVEEVVDPTFWYDLPPVDLDITGVELQAIQWAITQDNACQLMQDSSDLTFFQATQGTNR
ncbi:hypothetical protein AK830_g8966 [Neonectria ditissima]|uniref:Zn(2)-C6 fungal-type domain-containing protein n=1 Tax=Neonectria ditissima TaxID=78410 RepID=A0A0P7BAK0_9HYPO|nr:hypothetical protein AK830_g8966 [Neonectria ditissima]